MHSTKDKRIIEYYRKYSGIVMKVAYNRINDYHLAQDICQDTFIKLYQHIDELEEKKIKPWLIITADRTGIDYMRRAVYKRERASSQNLTEDSPLTGNHDPIEEYLNRLAYCGFLNMVLIRLQKANQGWFDIIWLRYCLGLPNEEVARRLNLTMPVMRGRLHRAKKWIRSNYDEKRSEV